MSHKYFLFQMRSLLFTLMIVIPITSFFDVQLVSAQVSLSSLSYEFGGPSQVDPGSGRANVYYIDSQQGNDSNTGRSPSTAWKSVEKVSGVRSTFQPGTMVLFKRGGDWRPNIATLTDLKGALDRPITLGAYGDLSLPRPRIHATVRTTFSSHIMLRDLDIAKVETTGTTYATIYNNIVRGSKEKNFYPSNGIQAWAQSSHIAMVSNFVYDLGANDALVVHSDSTHSPIGHVWILDNDVIGNAGMEDGIDLAMSEPSIGTHVVTKDVKVIGNRVQMEAVNGISTQTGKGGKMINGGHGGEYIWIIGNTLGNSAGQGINMGGTKRALQYTGNVIIAAGISGNKNSVEMYNAGDLNVFSHNTIIHTTNRDPIALQNGRFKVTHNLVFKTHDSGNYIDAGSSATFEADKNWYGPSTGLSFSYKSFDAWKALGYDTNSSIGNVPGIGLPPKTSFNNDPRNWKSNSFLNYFIPDSTSQACRGVDTPGAFDCQGNRLGMKILPLAGLENNGFGWAGPALVQAKLAEIGVEFGATPPTPPSSSLTPSSFSIIQGQSITLIWNSTNTTSCTGTNFNTNNNVLGSVTLSPETTTTYTLRCTGPGGEITKDVNVTVTPLATTRSPYTTKPSIPNDSIFSLHFDKLTQGSQEVSGQNSTYFEMDPTNTQTTRNPSLATPFPQIYPIGASEPPPLFKVGSNKQNEWKEYTIDIPQTITVTPKIRVASKDGVSTNPALKGTIGDQDFFFTIPTTNDWNNWTTVESLPLTLEQGNNQILRVTNLSQGADWHRLWFEETPPQDSPTLSLKTPPSPIVNNPNSLLEIQTNQSGTLSSTGDCIFTPTTVVQGSTRLTLTTTEKKTYSNCTLTLTNSGGQQSTPLTIPSFTLSYRGDLNQDRKVDIFDFTILVSHFGKNECNNVADLNNDCKVDIFDFTIFLGEFGRGGCRGEILDKYFIFSYSTEYS